MPSEHPAFRAGFPGAYQCLQTWWSCLLLPKGSGVSPVTFRLQLQKINQTATSTSPLQLCLTPASSPLDFHIVCLSAFIASFTPLIHIQSNPFYRLPQHRIPRSYFTSFAKFPAPGPDRCYTIGSPALNPANIKKMSDH